MKKRMYNDNIKQAVFENACDCLCYGYGMSYLNKLNLTDDETKEIWKAAIKYLSNSEN